MASVTGKTSEKIDQMLGEGVIGGEINASGQATLTKRNGSVLNIGSVSSDVVGAAVNAGGKLILTKRDGTTIDAGLVGSKPIDSYPVGSIFMSALPTNPGTTIGGTWQAWGSGRFPVGVDSTQAEFDTVEETGGEKTHTLSVAEMPSHTHSGTTGGAGAHSHTTRTWGHGYGYASGTVGVTRHSPTGAVATYDMASDTEAAHTHTVSTIAVGSGAAHNNLPPYITCYMWKRTA